MVMKEKKPVSTVLKSMKVGDTETWEIERLDVVRVTTGRVMTMKRREGWKLEMKTEGLVVKVTRTA